MVLFQSGNQSLNVEMFRLETRTIIYLALVLFSALAIWWLGN
jgi:hypothetical protein